jgi:hypothetical protein
MSPRQRPQPERPRAEPEIIPPDADYQRAARESAGVWVFRPWRRRFYLPAPGPLTFILAAAMFGGIAVVVLALVLGAFLIALPMIGLLTVSFLIAGLLRGPSRRRW